MLMKIKNVIADIIGENHIIGENQTGFIKNRFIGENIRFVLDVIHYTNKHNIPGFLFFVDFEKAFDRVDWGYIDCTLNYFQFGDSFHSWVKTLYKGSTACVLNNGHSTGFFPIERGVRQGCPLSPYLFILVAETLARKIIYDNAFNGLQFFGRT